MHDTIIVLDYGSQYTQLIVAACEANVYCELFPWDAPAADDAGPGAEGLHPQRRPQQRL